jgi:putative transposase
MTAADREAAARRARAQEIALWRWTLAGPAMDPALTARQRGQVVRGLASREHEGPDGKRKVPVSRRTLDRWVVARRDGGFDALVPSPRQCPPRTDAEVVDLAVGLKMENPARTAAQVRRVLVARLGPAQVPTERALQRWFAGRELNTRPDGAPPEAFGRFEAGTVNEIWTADLMNGPVVGGRDCHLSVIIDDRSRFLAAARFVRRPDAFRFAGVFRSALATCGVPNVLYCDYADPQIMPTRSATALVTDMTRLESRESDRRARSSRSRPGRVRSRRQDAGALPSSPSTADSG